MKKILFVIGGVLAIVVATALVTVVVMRGGIAAPAPTATLVPTDAPTPTPEPTPTPQDLISLPSRLDIQAYFSDSLTQIENLSTGLSGSSKALGTPDLYSIEWKQNIAFYIALIRNAHESLSNMAVPPEMQEVHDELLAATEDCYKATLYLASGIDNQNAGNINKAIDYLGKSAGLQNSCNGKLVAGTEHLAEWAKTHLKK